MPDTVLDGWSAHQALRLQGATATLRVPWEAMTLRILVDAGFLTGKKIKQWIFYRRDEKEIAAFLKTARNDV